MGLFTLASAGCALATRIEVFLAFRMLQGGVIAGYALSLAIIRDTTSEQRTAGVLGYVSMIMALAPMLGPMLGGLLDAGFGWRAVFWVYAGAGLGLLTLCWVDLGETAQNLRKTPDQGGVSALLRAPLFWLWSLCSAASTGAFYNLSHRRAAGRAGCSSASPRPSLGS